MGQHILDLLRDYLVRYGYWTVAVALLLENAGLPVPGETALLLASFLAYSAHQLRLPYIILAGVCAATVGDNLGFAIGYFGGRPLLDRYRHIFLIPERAFARGERFFRQYGAPTILFARFIFGMRVIAGPLAGVLRMPWRKFVLFNLLGATLWVSVISTLGYLFGRHWALLLHYLKRADITIVIILLSAALWWWRQHRKAGPEKNCSS